MIKNMWDFLSSSAFRSSAKEHWWLWLQKFSGKLWSRVCMKGPSPCYSLPVHNYDAGDILRVVPLMVDLSAQLEEENAEQVEGTNAFCNVCASFLLATGGSVLRIVGRNTRGNAIKFTPFVPASKPPGLFDLKNTFAASEYFRMPSLVSSSMQSCCDAFRDSSWRSPDEHSGDRLRLCSCRRGFSFLTSSSWWTSRSREMKSDLQRRFVGTISGSTLRKDVTSFCIRFSWHLTRRGCNTNFL